MNQETFVDVGTAAKLLGVSAAWLRRMSGRIGLPEYRSEWNYRQYQIKDVRSAAMRIADRKRREAARLEQTWV